MIRTKFFFFLFQFKSQNSVHDRNCFTFIFILASVTRSREYWIKIYSAISFRLGIDNREKKMFERKRGRPISLRKLMRGFRIKP